MGCDDHNLIFLLNSYRAHSLLRAQPFTAVCCLLFSNISFRSRNIRVFKICKLAKWWRHTLNQILFKYDEKSYLSQFVSEIFDFLQ